MSFRDNLKFSLRFIGIVLLTIFALEIFGGAVLMGWWFLWIPVVIVVSIKAKNWLNSEKKSS
jgi:hypothetical protein